MLDFPGGAVEDHESCGVAWVARGLGDSVGGQVKLEELGTYRSTVMSRPIMILEGFGRKKPLPRGVRILR
ncbi:MAG: hypothetical protein HBSAPP02_22030 [Phycisphaerae bacterium]|nr:MAG: hypothetical protein HBSAPP02_22030 [Phycisphaerae bacterium]